MDGDSPAGGVRVMGIRDLVGLGMEPEAGRRRELLGLEGPFGESRG